MNQLNDTAKTKASCEGKTLQAMLLGLTCLLSTFCSSPANAQTEDAAYDITAIETWPDDAVDLVESIFSRPFMPATFLEFRAYDETLTEEELLERHMEYVFHDSFIGPSHYPRVLGELNAFLEETRQNVSPAFRRLCEIGYETTISHDYRRGLERIDTFLRNRGFTSDEYVRALILQTDFLLHLDQDIDAANTIRDITAFTNRHPVSDLIDFDIAQIEIRVNEGHNSPAEQIQLLASEYWMVQDLMLPYTVSSTPYKIANLLYENGETDALEQVSQTFLEATSEGEYTYLRGHALQTCTLLGLAREEFRVALECALEAEQHLSNDSNIQFEWAVSLIEAALQLNETELADTYFRVLQQIPDSTMTTRNQFVVAELDARVLAQRGDLQSAYDTMLAFHHGKAVALDDEIQRLAANQMQYLQEESDRITERANLLNLQNTLQQRSIRLFQWLTALFALLLVVSVAFGLTVLRKNRDVIQARDEARRMSEVKSRFLANMSHEVRTPMNGVIGLAGALRNTSLDPRQIELVGLIQKSSKLLTKVLDDILDLARIESEKVIIEDGEFSPHELFQETSTFFLASTDRDGLELNFMPDVPENLLVKGDSARIRQVLYNLISNALKFTDRGSIDVRCWLDNSPSDNGKARLWYSVEDTGVGIPEDKLKSIFDPFVQADNSSTRRFGGLGLGLAISRQLIDLMGGTITANSIIGVGTHIEFAVPTDILADKSRQTFDDALLAPDQTVRVLIAEDHPMNRRVIEVLLDSLSITPVMVETGRDAVNAYRENRFAFVFLDIQMPIMDGLEALKFMKRIDREEGRRSPIYIAFTANAMTHQVNAYKDAGFDQVLTKPIDIRDLIGVLSTGEQSARPEPLET